MKQLGIFDFIKAAFKVPHNVILVTGGFLAGIVSFHPLAVWPTVAALEIVYLLALSHNSRFQAVVRAREQQSRVAGSNDVALRLVASLSSVRRERFETVRSRCLKLQKPLAAEASDSLGELLESQQLQSVNQLLWVFLRTLAYEQTLENFCSGMPRGEIAKTLRQTEAALEDAGLAEAMKATYRENADVLRKRLENLHRAEENLKNIAVRLVRVENSLMLIQEQALTRQDPAFVEAEVNSATAGLSSVEQMLNSIDLPSVEAGSVGLAPELLNLPSPVKE